MSSQQVDAMKEHFTREAEYRLRDSFPKRIRELDDLTRVQEFGLKGGMELVQTQVDKLCDEFKESLPVEGEANKKQLGINSAIDHVYRLLRPIIVQLIEDTQTVCMWIQLNIPKIEDGNNFGVSVQEEVLMEAHKIEAEASAMLDFFIDYTMLRAKLVSKTLKWSQICDYKRSIRELDEITFLRLRATLCDSRNYYTRLYDLLTKNVEKIRCPRNDSESQISIMY
ncbi:unnamed protein product [Protopolystoma xenopodis]|uniref:Proteasome activator PA28 C-terminal domain-containing protein n=1 Tax=Protopolystoma xenopodis TaxID=117903 RepID=A0A448X8S4_9PLAT|nr:unnamed protein product [Protopolystoma xenopodis]